MIERSHVMMAPTIDPNIGNKTIARTANTPTLAPPSIIGPAAP
jgi:hypothetical protein